MVAPNRTLQKEGSLTEITTHENNRKLKPIYLYLFNDLFVLAYIIGINKYSLKCQALLTDVKLTELPGINLLDLSCFEIECGAKKYMVGAQTQEEKHEWLNTFADLKVKMQKSIEYNLLEPTPNLSLL